METIRSSTVKAAKPHICCFCGCEIPKGERYECDVNVFDGKPYTWRSHIRCKELCGKIWDYVEPDEGMNGDEFCEAVENLMYTFYCPFHCDEYDKETCDCDRGFDADVCVKRFASFMEIRELMLANEPNRGLCWRMVITGGRKA